MSDGNIPEGYRPMKRFGGFIDHAGPYFYRERTDDDADDVYFYGLQTSADHRNVNGVIHGGAMMTFADTAMGATTYVTAKRPCATITMNSEFVAAGKPGSWIEARVTVTRQTRSLTFVRCVLCADGQPLLNASGVWKLFPPNLPGHDKPSD